MPSWEEQMVEILDGLGEAEARDKFIKGEFGTPGSSKSLVVERWLNEKDSARRSAREDETLRIARQALSNSRRANTIAIIAMILSAIVAIMAAIIGLMK